MRSSVNISATHFLGGTIMLKKLLSLLLVLVMFFCLTCEVSAVSTDYSPIGDTVNFSNYPSIDMNGHTDYVIYREEWRGNRIELALYNTNSAGPLILRKGWTLGFDDTSLYNDDEKYYLDSSSNKWVKFENGYIYVSNHCTEVFVSSRDIYDTQGNLVLKGNAGSKKNIDISRDTWSFKNIKGCSYKYFKLWYPDMKAWKLFTNYLDSLSGTCFGMATSAMALNSSLQNPSDFSCNNVSEIKKSSVSKSLGITAEEYIKYLYPSQSTIPDSMRTRDDLNTLYNDVKDFEQGKNGGVEIGVYGQVELEKHAGHALWGIKAIDESDCSKILVYDCNHPSEDCYIYLNKDSQGHFTSWSYDLRVSGIKPFGTNQAGQPEIKHFTISDGFFYEYLFNKLMGIDTSYPKGITDRYLVSVSEGIVLSDVSFERVSFEDVNVQTSTSNQLYWCSDNSIIIANDSNGINATITGNESSVDIQADSAQAELSISDNSVSVSSSESDDSIIVQIRKLDSNDDAITLNYEVTSGEEGVQISVDDDMNTVISGASEITLTLSENEVDSDFEILNYYNTTDTIEVDTGKTYIIEYNSSDESNNIIISEKDESASTNHVVSSYKFSNILGDADGDGSVSIIDVTMIQRKLADLEVDNPENVDILGDVTRDELDIVDATCIQRYLAEFENIYKIGLKID